MSSMQLPPQEVLDALDQNQVYHLKSDEDDWNQAVICGVGKLTGKKAHYDYFTCYEFRCLECGKTFDIGDYDAIYFGKNVPDEWRTAI